MNVIARKTLVAFWQNHPTAKAPLDAWFRLTRRQQWSTFADVRDTFNSADLVGGKIVFNIGGNNYRLVAIVVYRSKRVLILWVGTHAEYDRIDVAAL